MTDLPTQERNIAQVFQFPVIYDTMTVADNLAFPLRNRGVPEAEVDRKVREIAARCSTLPIARKQARGLTADQKQKVSLGRGLVRPDVNAILFDEPLTVIDPHLKWELRSQLKELHRRFGFTMVYVTHDQTEALTFADKVVVMYEGEVVQIGTPEDLFERPAHTFVGYFIGSPGMNVVPVDGRRRRSARLGAQEIELPGAPGGRRRARSSSASGRNSSGSAQTRHAGHDPSASRTSAATGSCGSTSTATSSTPSSARTSEIPADPQGRLRPGGHPHLRRLPARRDGGAEPMDKTWNNRAWFMVLPVLMLVAFNAIIPLMTVVNYSVQETFGEQRLLLPRRRTGSRTCCSRRALPCRAAAPARSSPSSSC